MELEVVNNIHKQIQKMLESLLGDKEQKQKYKLLIAEKYNKNNLMAGFFFGKDSKLCLRVDAHYHVLITNNNKEYSIIINDCNPIPKEEPSLD